jgi:DNA-binding GntR family transcriptional regulator
MSADIESLSAPQTITEMAYEAITSAILDNNIPGGSAVAESSLAALLGVSKTPVREALLRLRSVGLIEQRHNGSLYVIEASESSIVEAYELRTIIEVAAARYAAVRSTPEQQTKIASAAHASPATEPTKPPGRRRLSHWDDALHSAIWEATGNDRIVRAAYDAFLLTKALRARYGPPSDDPSQATQAHLSLADAICAGKAQAAGKIAGEHITDVCEKVVAAMQSSAETAGHHKVVRAEKNARSN